MDQDGPVGNLTDLAGPAGGFSDNLLAENISISSTLTIPNPAAGADDRVPARRQHAPVEGQPPRPLAAARARPRPRRTTSRSSSQPSQTATLAYTVKLRERNEGVGDTSALDNAMQNLSIDEVLHVKAIEAGANDFGSDVNNIPFDNGL